MANLRQRGLDLRGAPHLGPIQRSEEHAFLQTYHQAQDGHY